MLSSNMEQSPRTARLSSGYIRQMTEEKLLIPSRSITLMDTVGQGIGSSAYIDIIPSLIYYYTCVAFSLACASRISSSDLFSLTKRLSYHHVYSYIYIYIYIMIM